MRTNEAISQYTEYCKNLGEKFRVNGFILKNFANLAKIGAKVVVRVPLVPGITDTKENLANIAGLAKTQPGLIKVELLPYCRNRTSQGRAPMFTFERKGLSKAKNAGIDIFTAEDVLATFA